MATVLHGLADKFAGELLFDLAIVLLVAFVAHNHYGNPHAVATCLLFVVCCLLLLLLLLLLFGVFFPRKAEKLEMEGKRWDDGRVS